MIPGALTRRYRPELALMPDLAKQGGEVSALEARVNADNRNPRLACVIVLDTSIPMTFGLGPPFPIDELNTGFMLFCSELNVDETARERVEIEVITFGPDARIAIEFTEAKELSPMKFVAAGGAPIGGAVNLAVDQIIQRVQAYQDAGLKYFRPWLFILTDGRRNHGIEEERVFDLAAERLRSMEEDNEILVFPIGIGNQTDMHQLAKLSSQSPIRMNGLSFREFFIWLSNALASMSNTTPPIRRKTGETLGAEKPGILSVKSWGQV